MRASPSALRRRFLIVDDSLVVEGGHLALQVASQEVRGQEMVLDQEDCCSGQRAAGWKPQN